MVNIPESFVILGHDDLLLVLQVSRDLVGPQVLEAVGSNDDYFVFTDDQLFFRRPVSLFAFVDRNDLDDLIGQRGVDVVVGDGSRSRCCIVVLVDALLGRRQAGKSQ